MRFTSRRARRGVSLVLFGGAALAIASCDKSITVPSASLPAIEAASIDANAGAWRLIVLTTPDQVVVPDPAATTSAAYQAEIAAVKSAQAAMSDAQRRAVQYWTGAGVLRWNEIQRELVARYNLPPAPRANGTYPLPDAEKLRWHAMKFRRGGQNPGGQSEGPYRVGLLARDS